MKLPQQETFLNTLYGIDGEDYFDMVSIDLGKSRDAISSLNRENHIILTNVLKSKFHLNLGDTLMITMNNQDIAYIITGFIDSNIGIGHIGFISLENMEKVTNQYYTNFYIKGNQNPITLKNNIKRVFTKEILSIQTKKEMQAANKDKVDGIFNSINAYANIAMLVGIIGIINNIIASFLERGRDLAMYRCIGMSKEGLKRMLMTESIMIGVLGVVLGLITVVAMSFSIPVIVSIFWGKVRVQYAISKYLVLGFMGIASMIIVSYIPVLKGNKLSIIESLNYE